jgi:uncharacterized membrane protein YgdD (TMEM256/DUF423 family)
MQKLFLFIAALSGGIGVVLGAIGSHWLKNKITYLELNSFETGVRYQFIHVFALISVAILMDKTDTKLLNYSGIFFIIGMILFSGSLYGLSLKSLFDLNGLSILGPITPIGGILLIIGWGFLVVSIFDI